MAFKKSKMADSVSAFINTVEDKINNQQEEKQQSIQENQKAEINTQTESNQQNKTTSVIEGKPKKTQYRTPASLMTDQKQISLRLPIHIYEQIVECSQKEYISMNAFIIKTLNKELKQIQNQQQ